MSDLSQKPASADCLLWDVDGTLTDTTSLIAESLDYVFKKHFSRTLPYDELRALIGIPLKKQIRVFGEPEALGANSQDVMDDFIAFYEQQKSRERILVPVISLLIEGKKRGFPTALVTSKNKEELQNTLPRLAIAEYVDFAVTADDVLHPKPNPEGLLMALRHFQVRPEHAYYIGDTVHDMRAAKSAGVRGIGVTWGAAARARLEIEAPAHICETTAELRSVLFGTTFGEENNA